MRVALLLVILGSVVGHANYLISYCTRVLDRDAVLMGQAVVGLSDEQAAVLAAAENFKIKTGFCKFLF